MHQSDIYKYFYLQYRFEAIIAAHLLAYHALLKIIQYFFDYVSYLSIVDPIPLDELYSVL